MRHHQIRGWRAAPSCQATTRVSGVQGTVTSPHPPPALDPVRAIELRDLLGWLRQRLTGEHTVRACVLLVEPVGNGDVLLLLGEADHASGSSDPPRIKARLDAPGLDGLRAERSDDFDPATLVNRTVVLVLRTGLRRRFGRGAGVQAKVIALLSIGESPVEAVLDRETTLRRLRAERLPFGPGTWVEPEDPQHIAIVVSEFGDARRDIEHQLQDLEAAGLLRIDRVWAHFEGPSAERSLADALARVASLHAEHGLAATILARGGGPVGGFAPLNAHAVAQAATAEKVPGLIVGLGHAGTSRTALDEVASRCEPTPTAAAALVRDLVQRTGIRASTALVAYDAALQEELEAAGRIALARAVKAFDEALHSLIAEAEQQLRSLDRELEQSLLAIAASAAEPRGPAAASTVLDADPSLGAADGALSAEVLTLMIAADTGRVITSANEARASDRILLQFPDGMVSARIEPRPRNHH